MSHPPPAARHGVLGTACAERRWQMPAGAPAAWPEAGEGILGTGALLDALPSALTDAAHDLGRVEALAYALLLLSDPSARERQLACLPAPDDAARLSEVLDWVPDAVRLHLAQIALPTLRRLGSSARARILDRALVRADGRVTVRELALSEALGVLSHASSQDRERVLDAVLATVAHDGTTTEADRVRLLALTLGLPCPPEHDALRAIRRERRERIQAELLPDPMPE